MSEYIFLISKNKLTIKKNKNIRKAEETKEEKRKSRLNKSGRPGEDISRYPHFEKEEYFFFWPYQKLHSFSTEDSLKENTPKESRW